MSGDFYATIDFSFKSHKVNWPVVIKCPVHFTNTCLISISLTGANISFTEKGVLQWSCNTGELFWWMRTSYAHSDRCLNKRPGAYCKVVSRGGKWSKEEKLFHINVLELLALKSAILASTKNFSYLTIHVQVNKKVALASLLNTGGTRNPQLLKIRKSIWNHLLSHQITISIEYLPSRLNVRTDWESRNATDSSD